MFSDWNDFYENVPQGRSVSGKKNTQIHEEKSYYIKFCFFTGFTTASVVFNSSSNDTCALLEDCSFISNSNTNGSSGSFQFGIKGNCVQNRICSFESFVTSDKYSGIYCNAVVTPSASSQNKIFDSTISCSGKSYLGFSNLALAYGYIDLKNINVSHAKMNRFIVFTISVIDTDCDISFCSFSNNTGCDCTSGGVYPMWIPGQSLKNVNYKYCNIMKNYQKGGDFIYTEAPNLNFNECTIYQNVFYKYMFVAGDNVQSITIDSCYIDNPSFDPNANNIKSIRNSINSNFEYMVPFLSSAKCEAKIGLKVAKLRIKEYKSCNKLDCTSFSQHSIYLFSVILCQE